VKRFLSIDLRVHILPVLQELVYPKLLVLCQDLLEHQKVVSVILYTVFIIFVKLLQKQELFVLLLLVFREKICALGDLFLAYLCLDTLL
jgi:hypothetical protein